MTAGGDTPSIELDGITYAWDRARGLMLMNGMPVAAFLLESTLAGMMWGFERMVGRERFDLAMRAAGRLSVEDEWRTFISQLPAPEEGMAGMRRPGSGGYAGGSICWRVGRACGAAAATPSPLAMARRSISGALSDWSATGASRCAPK